MHPDQLQPGLQLVIHKELTVQMTCMYSHLLQGSQNTNDLTNHFGVGPHYIHTMMQRLIDKGLVMKINLKRDRNEQNKYAALVIAEDGSSCTVE